MDHKEFVEECWKCAKMVNEAVIKYYKEQEMTTIPTMTRAEAESKVFYALTNGAETINGDGKLFQMRLLKALQALGLIKFIGQEKLTPIMYTSIPESLYYKYTEAIEAIEKAGYKIEKVR